MKKQFNVGLIGFGNAGRIYHAPFIESVDGFNLVKIRETKKEICEYIFAKYPQAVVVHDVKDMFHDSNIDIIIIAAPNHVHYSLTKDALMSGKHVVVDKPFTILASEADELIALSKRQNKLLTIYHNRRFTSDFKTIKKVIESNLLGDLVEYEAHFDRYRNVILKDSWKETDIIGAGILYDMGPHLIDQALQLFHLPNEVTGDIRIQRKDGKTIDNFEVILHYPNLKVTLKGSMLVRETIPQFMLFGINGSFIKYGMDCQEEMLRNGMVPSQNNCWGEEPKTMWGTINTDYKGMNIVGKIKSEKGNYREYYDNLYAALSGETELSVKPEDARNVIKIIELAIKSSAKKKTLKYE